MIYDDLPKKWWFPFSNQMVDPFETNILNFAKAGFSTSPGEKFVGEITVQNHGDDALNLTPSWWLVRYYPEMGQTKKIPWMVFWNPDQLIAGKHPNDFVWVQLFNHPEMVVDFATASWCHWIIAADFWGCHQPCVCWWMCIRASMWLTSMVSSPINQSINQSIHPSIHTCIHA